MVSVTRHALLRMLKLRGRRFISDQTLLQMLNDELEQIESAADKAEAKTRAARDLMLQESTILLSGGIQIQKSDMARILHWAPWATPSSVKSGPFKIAPDGQEGEFDYATSLAPEDGGDPSEHLQGMDAIHDLMDRYGANPSDLSEHQQQDLRDLFQLESTQRILALHLGQIQLLEEARRIQVSHICVQH